MISHPSRRRGREAEYVKGQDGKPIIGLSRHKTSSRYYATHSEPRVYFGRDFTTALIRYREWDAQQNQRSITIHDPNNFQVVDAVYDDEDDNDTDDWGITIALPPGADFDGDDAFEWIKANHDKLPEHVKRQIDRHKSGTIFFDRQSWGIPEDLFWAWVRKAITENPQLAAERTGLPLDRLHQFKPLQPSPTLEALGNLYEEKASITDDWRRKSKQCWDEFAALVKVKTVREIKQEQVAEYLDTIMDTDKSQTFIKHRFGVVKRVFNFARGRGIAPDEMRTILDYCAILQAPKANSNNPHPISVDDFQALLKVASDKWSAILLGALNFCMYIAEIILVEKSECDLEKKTLVTDRNKTNVTRVAVLWDRTATALARLPKTEHSHFFLSYYRTPYDAEGLRTAFRKLRTRAGVADTVKFSDIRDGAYSAAIEHGADLLHAKLLAGHETGISDAYIRRNPKMVADACAAIERHYFPAPKEDKPPKVKATKRRKAK